MLLSIFTTILFFLTCIAFGIIYLKKVLKIKSLIFLASFSISTGISFYIFICHTLSFFFGPSKASIIAIFILLFLLLIILGIFKGEKDTPITDISKQQFIYLLLITSTIIICTLVSIHKHGVFDEPWHIPLSLSIFQNNIYPPRDFLRPDYALAYHFGGDLLAGTLNHISKLSIFNSFELISGIFSGITFLSFFSLAWILTRKYKTSLISAFCCYFGGGLIWINAILSFFKNSSNVSFIEHFLLKGIHGAIYNAPSVITFSSTSGIGYPMLILCLFLFYNLINKNNFKTSILDIISLSISLFSLSLVAGWLCMTFIASTFIYLIVLISIRLIIRRRDYIPILLNTGAIFLIFIFLNFICGNQMYAQDQFLGRADIFNIILKKDLFTVTAWDNGGIFTKTISCFSWDFISAFGLSFILFPVILFYLKKSKEKLGYILFLIPLLTMPLPVLFEFKLNPVDFNRLFGFGNTMLILLITVGLGTIGKNILKNKLVLSGYMFCFTLSPIAGLLTGVLLCPQMYSDPGFINNTLHKLQQAKSLNSFYQYQTEISKDAFALRHSFWNKYKNEIGFFRKEGESGDVAISSIPGVPIYSGVYTLIPSMMYGLKNQIYSGFDNIYPTIITTLDPHLLSELNIKWVGYDEISKSKLSNETIKLLSNKNVFMLSYQMLIMPDPDNNVIYEIYHIEDLSQLLKERPRKTGWILVNKDGTPIEILEKLHPNISLFSTEHKALQYLKELLNKHVNLKNQLITAQPIIIKTTQEQLAQSGLSVKLEERI